MAYEDRIMRMAANANRRRNEGIANPHIRERRLRSLRTPSQQTIGPVGRGPLSVAESAYNKSLRGQYYGENGYLDALKKVDPSNPRFRSLVPEPDDITVTDLPPELFESMSINEGEQAGWRIGENPYFGMKRWNQNDIEGQTWGVDYTSEPETPWDNWFGNLIRKLGGRNRGGLASLRYAR